MFEVIFLWSLASIWIVFASVQDLRTREIFNWLNLSLIIFAIGFRFFYSFFELNDFNFLYQGLIGLGVFIVLGEIFYHIKMFAGGDERLFWSMGAIIPLNVSFLANFKIFLVFILIFLFLGFLYGLIATIIQAVKNKSKFKKEFSKQFRKNKLFVFFLLVLAIVFIYFSLIDSIFLVLAILFFIFPYLYLLTKSVDESCMVRKLKTSKLTEGDLLYKDVKVGNKLVKASWDGLTKKDIVLIKKKKEVLVRFGIQFAPVFLISFIGLILSLVFGWADFLRNPFW